MNRRTAPVALLLALALAGCASQSGVQAQGTVAPRARCASAPSPGAPGGEPGIFVYLLCVESP